jgi:ribosomal protein S12 methylthiotransferase accessory factor
LIEVEYVDDLTQASFALAHARIEWQGRVASEGWGKDRLADRARDKAIGEAVERFAYSQLPASATWASAAQLTTYIAPNSLTGLLPEQYAAAGFPCRPFSEATPGWWVEAFATVGDGSTWVLADCVCSRGAFEPAYQERLVTRATSSGCASATQLDMGIFRATLEVLERDAFMRHWFAQEPGRRIDLATLPDQFRRRLEVLRDGGCETGLQCLTLGHHPTLLAWAQHRGRHFTCIGTSCAAEPEAALDSALSELELPALARMMGVPAMQVQPVDVRTPADHAQLYATADYFQCADALLGLQDDATGLSFGDLATRVQVSPPLLYERLAQGGHPVYWVDLTPPQASPLFGNTTVHVVRAVVPGLIPLAFGQRLVPQAFDLWCRPGRPLIHPFS